MVDSAPPERLVVRAVAEYPHDVEAFTQGLLWHDGALYESTGLYGRSTVRRVDLASGKVEQRRALEAMFFGEGLTLVGERFYLLTWRSGIGMVLDRRSFEEVSRFTYEGEGWGLCYDGSRLVMSNGSSRLAFYDPAGFTFLGEVEVRLAGKSQAGLNELECAGGQVYANIFGADSIVRIDPRDGRINAVIDAGGLLDPTARHAAGVLNGIAHRPESDTFLITGKNWPKVFEVAFEQ